MNGQPTFQAGTQPAVTEQSLILQQGQAPHTGQPSWPRHVAAGRINGRATALAGTQPAVPGT